MNHKHISAPMLFIVLFGMVSMLSDMTHESASSIRGAYLSILGASAGTIGFISGLGELAGYSLRYAFGRITDRTRQYWPMVIAGYVIDIIAVPALALVGPHGWLLACLLFVIQRIGKAIKKPAKDTVISFAASQEGAGRSFALQEMLDQIGAFLGPVLLYLIMLFKTDGTTYETYSFCFAMLIIPATATIALLLYTKSKFPHPEQFEPEPKAYIPFHLTMHFRLYIAGIGLFAFGFIDYSLVVMHVTRTFSESISTGVLPLLYAGAMITDAVSAMIFGYMFDRHGTRALVLSTLLSAPFAIFIFAVHSVPMLCLGIAMWGIGMGAQESILKAAITTMVPKESRATGYGIFACSFGVCWFLGSWLLGVLYDFSIATMVAVSVITQLAAIPLYVYSKKCKI